MDIQKLKGHIPESVLAQLPDTIAKFNVNTTLRLAHFLSQCAHESGNFVAVKENLNYGADRLLVVFPKYFNKTTANQCSRQPEKIANITYANRMGNGDEESGDGYKYSGRGYIQLTGKDNYKAFDKFVDEDILTLPGLVATKYPLLSAAFYFNTRAGLWTKCDAPLVNKDGKDVTENAVVAVTKAVNGGLIGYKSRLENFHKFYNILK